MTRKSQIIIRSRSSKPLLHHPTSSSSSSSSSNGRIAEVAGGTTAECAAVWCCFPCSVVSLLILAVYKVPAGLCHKAIQLRTKRRLIKKGLLPLPPPPSSSPSSCSFSCSCSSSLGGSHGGEEWEWDPAEEVAVILLGGGMDHELVQLEKEMGNCFYSTGFWRSPSQRDS